MFAVIACICRAVLMCLCGCVVCGAGLAMFSCAPESNLCDTSGYKCW